MPGLVPGIHAGQPAPVSGAWVYNLTKKPNGILYVGVTRDLVQRIRRHREEQIEGFTKRYAVNRLVFFEAHEDIRAAIQREKNLKHWSRAWKVRLVLDANPLGTICILQSPPERVDRRGWPEQVRP